MSDIGLVSGIGALSASERSACIIGAENIGTSEILSENYRTNFPRGQFSMYVLEKSEFSNYVSQRGRIFFKASFHRTLDALCQVFGPCL